MSDVIERFAYMQLVTRYNTACIIDENDEKHSCTDFWMLCHLIFSLIAHFDFRFGQNRNVTES